MRVLWGSLNDKMNDLEIAKLRLSLFEDAIDLAHMNSQLVTRKKVGSVKSVVEKHVEDIWSLVCSIKDKNHVPRVLLKNGKCSNVEFEQSQSNSSQAVSCSTSNYLVDQSLTGTTNSLPANSC